MEKWKKKSVELLMNMLIGENKSPSVVPYVPQKTASLSKDRSKYFKRVRPERVGVSSARIYSMLSELEREKRANVHNLLVLRRGKVICDCSHPGYSTQMPHLSHSLSKTVTGFAVGMLVDDGRLSLDAKIIDFFPDVKVADKRASRITVENLLAMSSGATFAELGCATSDDWIESFFSCELKYTPGNGFSYNSMNSYLLAAIVEKISGESLDSFLEKRLFAPLGITNYFWEKSPVGIVKGGWGLYLSPESWAKIGEMTLAGGVFKSNRVISAKWLSEALSTKSISDGSLGDFNYGYHVWVGSDNGEYLFNGMFGQNVWVCPKNDIVVVLNSGNNELFQRSAALSIIRKYLGADIKDTGYANFYMALLDKKSHFFESRHWIRPKRKIGFLAKLGLLPDKDEARDWRMLEGEYRFADNNASILPVFVRMMQNNLEGYLESMRIHVDGAGALTITFREAGREYVVPVGIYKFKSTVLDFNGEKYLVSAIGEAMEDEDRNPIFKLELLFPELPNTRKIKISIRESGVLLFRMSENPDRHVVDNYLEQSLGSSPLISIAIGMLRKRLGVNFISDALDLLFAPSIVAARTGTERFSEVFEAENKAAKASREKYKSVSSLVSGFLKDKDSEVKQEEPKRSPFAAIGDLIRRRKTVIRDGDTEAYAEEKAYSEAEERDENESFGTDGGYAESDAPSDSISISGNVLFDIIGQAASFIGVTEDEDFEYKTNENSREFDN